MNEALTKAGTQILKEKVNKRVRELTWSERKKLRMWMKTL